MNKGIYESNCHLECGQCKYFQVDADRREDTTCKRLDHKRYKLAVPWFKSYDCGQFHCNVCSDFEPRESSKWLHEHWTTMDDYIADYEAIEGKSFFDNKYTVLCLDNNTDVRYYVNRIDYFNNTFINADGTLKWVKKCYYKKTRSNAIGYKLVWEYNK